MWTDRLAKSTMLFTALGLLPVVHSAITLSPTITGGLTSDNYEPGQKRCPKYHTPCSDTTRCEPLDLVKEKGKIGDKNLKAFTKIFDSKTKRRNLRTRHLRIRMIKKWSDSAEFGAYFLYVVNQLLYAETHELIGDKAPFVYMPETGSYHSSCSEGGNITNFWERGFQPVTNINYEKIPEADIWEFTQDTIKNLHFDKSAVRSLPYTMGEDDKRIKGDVATRNWLDCQRNRVMGIVNKYIRVKPEIAALAEKRWAELFSANQSVVCAHVSGEEKFMSNPKSIHQFEHALGRELQTQNARALVSGTNLRFVNKMKGLYGDRIVKMPAIFIEDEDSALGKKLIAQEEMIEIIMMTKCNSMLKSWALSPELSVYLHTSIHGSPMKTIDLDLNNNTVDNEHSSCYIGHKCEEKPMQLKSSTAMESALKNGACSRRCTAYRAVKQKGQPAQTMTGEQTAVLVVAHYTENLDWLENQPFCYMIMEKVGNGDHAGKDPSTVVVNKGNEASSYLKFLGLNYKNLPDHVLMTHGKAVCEHNADLRKLLRSINLDAYGYASLNGIQFPFLEYDDICDLHTFWTQIMPELKFTPKTFMDISTACCAQFVVSKERILKRSQDFYDRLFDFSVGSADFGHSTDSSGTTVDLSNDERKKKLAEFPMSLPGCEQNLALEFNSFTRGEVLELSWHKIFGENWHTTLLNSTEFCGSAKICPQDLPILRAKNSTYGVVDNEKDPFWNPASKFLKVVKHQSETLKSKRLGRNKFIRTKIPSTKDVNTVLKLSEAPVLVSAGRNLSVVMLGSYSTVLSAFKQSKVAKLTTTQHIGKATGGSNLVVERANRKHAYHFSRHVAKGSFTNETLNILLWDDKTCDFDFYGLRVEPYLEFEGCGAPIRFYSALHRSLAAKMDAVVVSDRGNKTLKSLLLMESLRKRPGNQVWAGCRLKSDMDKSLAKELGSNFISLGSHSDFRISRYSFGYLGDSVHSILRKPEPLEWVEKIPGIALIENSNCEAKPRVTFVTALLKAFPRTHAIGKCWKNTRPMTGWKGGHFGNNLNAMANLRPYMFTLCYDDPDVNVESERIYQALAVGSVPIYKGHKDIESLIPCKKCIINANNFQSVQQLVDVVQNLIEDRAQYLELLDWKKTEYDAAEHPAFEQMRVTSVDSSVCRFAKKLSRSQKFPLEDCGSSCIKQVQFLQKLSP
uniref:Fucosyltransferase n=2 Tax=Lotharella globosa TaxID=91324 RepID=A0A7S4DES7_9EUKA|mmetsp:Transcript_12852/g.26252  ORF Transcript_12852/g.26252 Transcript_12852/m.26252 type:complete len:1188 (+) Transcript_12852:107-3670(+)